MSNLRPSKKCQTAVGLVESRTECLRQPCHTRLHGSLLGHTADPFVSHCHAVIVGQLGMVALGAVGLSNLVFFFVTVFFSFLLVVTVPAVADALALGDRPRVRVLSG